MWPTSAPGSRRIGWTVVAAEDPSTRVGLLSRNRPIAGYGDAAVTALSQALAVGQRQRLGWADRQFARRLQTLTDWPARQARKGERQKRSGRFKQNAVVAPVDWG